MAVWLWIVNCSHSASKHDFHITLMIYLCLDVASKHHNFQASNTDGTPWQPKPVVPKHQKVHVASKKNKRIKETVVFFLKSPMMCRRTTFFLPLTCRAGIARKFLHPSKRNVNSWLVILLSCQGAPPTPIFGEDLWRIWKGTIFFERNNGGGMAVGVVVVVC